MLLSDNAIKSYRNGNLLPLRVFPILVVSQQDLLFSYTDAENHSLLGTFCYLARVRLVYAGGIKRPCRRQEMTDFDLDSIMAQKGYIPGVPVWGITEDYDGDTKL